MKAIAGGALLALQSPDARADAQSPEYFASSLTQKQLEEQKLKTVNQLIDGFWNDRSAKQHITRSFFGGTQDRDAVREGLLESARMYIPSAEKGNDVLRRNSEQIEELARNIPEGQHGLLLDGDEQQLYVIKNIGGNRMQFVKGYPVSTSSSEWSNLPDSRGTPLGLHSLAAMRKGLLGEIVSGKGKRKFVDSLESKDFQTAPTLITTAILITGPTTPLSRGIYVHGTNYQNLLSRVASSGCIRMSSVDISDLLNFVAIGKLQGDMRTVIGGTPIMIASAKYGKEGTPKDRKSTVPERMVPERSTEETPAPPSATKETPAPAPAESQPRKGRRPLPERVIPPKE